MNKLVLLLLCCAGCVSTTTKHASTKAQPAPQFKSLVSVRQLIPPLSSSYVVRAPRTTNVTLAWNHSISPDVVGYRIYWGTNSGSYSQMLQVENTNRARVTGLLLTIPYYFAATAIDALGMESVYSNEVSWKYVWPVYNTIVTVNYFDGSSLVLTNPTAPSQFFTNATIKLEKVLKP